MKKISLLSIILIAFLSFFLTNCKKDEEPQNEEPTIPANAFKVDIDGETFIPEFISASNFFGFISIMGSVGTTSPEYVSISVNDNIETGTYSIISESINGKYDTGNMYMAMSATSGTLNISKHDTVLNVIIGTFEFEAEEMMGIISASLTNGSFTVSY